MARRAHRDLTGAQDQWFGISGRTDQEGTELSQNQRLNCKQEEWRDYPGRITTAIRQQCKGVE